MDDRPPSFGGYTEERGLALWDRRASRACLILAGRQVSLLPPSGRPWHCPGMVCLVREPAARGWSASLSSPAENVPPAEFEGLYDRSQETPVMVAGLTWRIARESCGGSGWLAEIPPGRGPGSCSLGSRQEVGVA